MECECFSKNQFCDGCTCGGCQNTVATKDKVEEARKNASVMNPHAFDKKAPIDSLDVGPEHSVGKDR